MARAVSKRRTIAFTIAAWIVALVIFFPILYTIITSFKSETEAIQGFNLIPSGTVESYAAVQAQSNYFKFFLNSVVISIGSTLLALVWDDLSPLLATNYDKVNLLKLFGPQGGLLVTYALLALALLLVLGWERYFFRRRGRTVADTRGALA